MPTETKPAGRFAPRAVSLLALALFVGACGSSPTAPTGPLVTVTSVSPAQGSTFGGTQVTISGANFGAAPSVTIGGAAATAVTVTNTTTIVATTAPHSAGAANVVVNTADGKSGTLTNGYTYVAQNVMNAPPVIQSIAAAGSRQKEPSAYADLGEAITVTATVTDAETAVSALTFEWSADVGAFSGTGSRVVWTAPRNAGVVTLRLKVIERYVGADPSGLPIPQENTAAATATVDVHDEIGEVGGMARDFLLLFSDSNIGPDAVVHNFLDGCGAGGTGKRDERRDTAVNRQDFRIVNSSVGAPRVTVAFGGLSPYRSRQADAWAAVDVDWTSQCLVQDPTVGCPAVGATRRDRGVDWVTATYDPPSKRWWLCDSDYEAISSTSSTRYKR
jgi:hypothetical protein